MFEGIPVLSIIALSPIVAAVAILCVPKNNGTLAKMIGLGTMILGLVLSGALYVEYLRDLPPSTSDWIGTLRYVEELSWVPSFGINYILGVDGLSLTLVFLTAIVGFGGALISWGVDDRPREFFAFFMLLVAGVQGVFVAVDAFLLFFFYEIAVLPMYVMIVIWGWKERREYAAMKLTLFILIGSFIALIPFIYLYFQMPSIGLESTFDLRVLTQADFPIETQRLVFLPLFIGFAILAGMFPFHNWSPDGHVAAPTAVSMIHAGVLMKLGAYAAMRLGIQILPEGTVYWMPFIIILTLVNVIYGALIAMRQRDLKYMIGYSSVSHMGLVVMGFAAMNRLGFLGAGLQMVSHGLMTAMFFSCVGIMYDRTHTRDMDKLSGMMKPFGWVAVAFILGSFVSMGMPGLSGFVAEFPIFQGVWQGGGFDLENTIWGLNPANFYKYVAMASVLGIAITAAYLLRAVTSVFFGEYNEDDWHDMRPILAIDKLVLGMFCGLLIAIGVFPAIISPIVESGILPVVDRIDVAREAYTVIDSIKVATTTLLEVVQ